ncbi:unnamed protein product [Spirodela intermedia]|uniref:C3H1-type domain-containing protein n=1 Tax=Spirodela intermedia TaxID=51605 RepID=A0A7I8K133_SPIIN|nr:unnamed protein product [Spirodela intermedia]
MAITADSPATRGSILLELSAANDLPGFRRALEEGRLEVDLPGPWYGRWGRTMGFELRTPLMIAAMYGSVAVLEYILAVGTVDVNRACGSDGATALHCAAGGGSPASADAVRMLVDASADVAAVDGGGNKPGDVIPRCLASGGSSKTRSLKALLRGGAASTTTACEEDFSPSKREEKKREKEYPPDLTLPDIKNGIYTTDEFRMYTFKVKPCSRAYSHDWTECPFVHPGENARRRDPRKYHYSCVPCPEFRKGSCRNGDACEYAHGVFECWLHPAQYRTRLCKDETGCTRRVCFFAHKPEELRQPGHSSGAPPLSPSGSVLLSPKSPALPPLDVTTAAAVLMNQSMTSSAASSSAAASAAAWLSQTGGVMTSTPKLPTSRLKTSLSSRTMEVDLDLMGLEAYHQQQQQQVDDMASMSSPSCWKFSLGGASPPSGYGDVYGSPESSSLLSQLQGLSLRHSMASGASQFQPPSGIQMHQSNVSQQLPSGYAGSNPQSSLSSSFGLHSLANTIMKSKASAFAKRSQSFCDRGVAARPSALGIATFAPPAPSLSDWASPDGKLDWGIRGEELSKLRKCTSFGFRSNGNVAAATAKEPDVSWVQSLVKDGGGVAEPPCQQQRYETARGNEFSNSATDIFSPWMDQEQMVA